MKLLPTVLVFVGTLLRAQPFPADSSAGERPDWGRIRDSLEIRTTELELRAADLLLAKTDFWHRVLPRITVSASFGIRNLTFVDVTEGAPFIIPTDLYRLTLTLSISDLISSYEHERAHLMKEQAHLALALARTRQFMDRHVLEERAGRLRCELSLLEEELRLTERILRYYALLFEQGKTSFDVYMRAELRALEVRQKLQRLRTELAESSFH